jgi:hypothetical protein
MHGISACTRTIRASLSQNRTKDDLSQLLNLSKLASTQSLVRSALQSKRERRFSLLFLVQPAGRAILNKTFVQSKQLSSPTAAHEPANKCKAGLPMT